MRRQLQKGFTLVELLVTITIAAILISIAAPAYTSLTNANRLATQANDILSGLMIARSEAIRLNQRVIFCRSDDGTTCSTASGAWLGWLVFVDSDGSDSPSAAEILRIGAIANAGGMSVLVSPAITAQSNRIRIGSDGFARTAPGSSAALLQAKLSICIATTQPPFNARELAITAGGRPMITPVNKSGSCPTPANS